MPFAGPSKVGVQTALLAMVETRIVPFEKNTHMDFINRALHRTTWLASGTAISPSLLSDTDECHKPCIKIHRKIHTNTYNETTRKQKVDLYIPRKCSATNALITPKDHASVQINVGHVNEEGIYTGENTAYTLCGKIRKMGKGDAALNCLATDDGFLQNVVIGPKPE